MCSYKILLCLVVSLSIVFAAENSNSATAVLPQGLNQEAGVYAVPVQAANVQYATAADESDGYAAAVPAGQVRIACKKF